MPQIWVQTCRFCGKREESESVLRLAFPYSVTVTSPEPKWSHKTHEFCSTECLAMWVGDKYLNRAER